MLRLANNLSQTDLARALSEGSSVANSLVSKIENGRHAPDGTTLNSLASALGCTVGFLSRKPSALLATSPWLRAYADAPARAVESIVADNLLASETISTLGLKRIPDKIPVFTDDVNDDEAIERYALEVRSAAEIAEGAVVGNAMRAADRLGCVVLPLSSELGRHLGLSQRIDGVAFARVSRAGESYCSLPGDRQRFTIAHELGHLGLHADAGPPETADEARRIERQAHRFAGAFLAPAEPLLEDWHERGSRMTLTTLADLKATWGVSIKALVIRFQQLGIVSPDQATSLYKQISKRGWNKSEPVPITNEEPVWLSKALEHWSRTEVGLPGSAVASAAQAAGLSERHLARWVDWTPPPGDLDADVVALRPRDKDVPALSAPGRVLSIGQRSRGRSVSKDQGPGN
ncbi:MAG: ImmA/IrrE family metallo-endopeptidase [Actinobacteria bacterium]|nr:ImmA/IrrE family metallo-endopeptidase [Actinomycetota bacterium]